MLVCVRNYRAMPCQAPKGDVNITYFYDRLGLGAWGSGLFGPFAVIAGGRVQWTQNAVMSPPSRAQVESRNIDDHPEQEQE